MNYLKSLFSEVYLKDIVERKKIEREDALGMILDLLCSSVGSLTNPAKITDSLKSRSRVSVSPNTVRGVHIASGGRVSFLREQAIRRKRKVVFRLSEQILLRGRGAAERASRLSPAGDDAYHGEYNLQRARLARPVGGRGRGVRAHGERQGKLRPFAARDRFRRQLWRAGASISSRPTRWRRRKRPRPRPARSRSPGIPSRR